MAEEFSLLPPEEPEIVPVLDDWGDDLAIRVRGLKNQFGEQVVHDGLDLDVRRGEILGVVGGSGSRRGMVARCKVRRDGVHLTGATQRAEEHHV